MYFLKNKLGTKKSGHFFGNVVRPHAKTNITVIPCFFFFLQSCYFSYSNAAAPQEERRRVWLMAVHADCPGGYTNISKLLFPVLTSRALFLAGVPQGTEASGCCGGETCRQIQKNSLRNARYNQGLFGWELASYQTSGTLGCNEPPLNTKDGGWVGGYLLGMEKWWLVTYQTSVSC